MRILLSCGLLFFVASNNAVTESELKLEYQAGWTVERHTESTEVTRADEISMTVNGQEVPIEMVPELEKMKEEMSRSNEVIETTDEIEEVQDGRPTVVVRRFDQLSLETTDEGETEEPDAPLEGYRIRITGDDEDAEVELLDDIEVEDRFLEGHRAGYMDVYVLLPEESVELGAAWTVDGTALERMLASGGATLFDRSGPDSESIDEVFDEALAEAELEATWASTEEWEGERCARIDVPIEIDAELSGDEALSFMDSGEEDQEFESVSIDIGTSGLLRVWISLENSRIVAEELRMDLAMDMEMAFEPEDGVRVEMVIEAVGEMTYDTTYSFVE